jgi:nicotinate-nucleotide pyrophosphorylase (carboxylating)
LLDSRLVKRIVSLALDEDLSYGDITSYALSDPSAIVKVSLLAGEETIVCASKIAELVLDELGRNSVEIFYNMSDGQRVLDGECILELKGPVSLLLAAERTILNFMQRLSGIAFHTHQITQRNPEITFLDTRKTTPGWRVLEKYAVCVGGGKNHRMHLADMVLVKNNHIDTSRGELDALFERILKNKPFYTPIQIEVRSLNELEKVSVYNPHSVLLDNMSAEEMKDCIKWLNLNLPNCLVEASGRIDSINISEVIKAGVKLVSTSYLIHGAKPSDLKMRIS